MTVTYYLDTAEVSCVNAPATLFGTKEDRYFAEIISQPGLDIAGHSATFVSLATKLPKDAVILDIGANIGLTVLIGSRLVPNGRVIAVEPAPLAYTALRKSCEANGLTNCKVINKCIGDTSGVVPFVENAAFLAGSFINSGVGEQKTVDVPITTLDSLVMTEQLDRVDLIKIDVEGYELDVLKGAFGTIDHFNPTFVIEFNAYALTANRNLSPLALLNFVVEHFGSFQVIRENEWRTISTRKEICDFIYSHMVTYACVEDIIFGRPVA